LENSSPQSLPHCPKCSSIHVYEDRELLVCPECSYEWSEYSEKNQVEGEEIQVYKDAFGNSLADGDSVTIIKDLKVKGAVSALKVGTRIKNIRLVDGDHNIDCKIEGFGAMKLKSEFVKKI
jgi:protein PhnA